MANKQQKLISYRSGGWKSTIRVPEDLVSGEVSLSGSERPIFSLYPHMIERVRELALWGPFHKGTNPIYEALPSWPKHLSRAPPPNIIPLGVRISVDEF